MNFLKLQSQGMKQDQVSGDTISPGTYPASYALWVTLQCQTRRPGKSTTAWNVVIKEWLLFQCGFPWKLCSINSSTNGEKRWANKDLAPIFHHSSEHSNKTLWAIWLTSGMGNSLSLGKSMVTPAQNLKKSSKSTDHTCINDGRPGFHIYSTSCLSGFQ